MAGTDITRRKIKSKISAIKKINDNPQSFVDNIYDAYKDDLESTNGIVKKNISSFTSKIKGGTQNKKDIFEEIIDTIEGFLGTDKEDPVNPKTKPIIKNKILKYSKEAAHRTLQISKQVLIDETKRAFFDGSGLCNSAMVINSSPINLSPQSFDFVNTLKVDPLSISGKLMYESMTDGINRGLKFNRTLYNQFDLGSLTSIKTNNNTSLFTLAWNSGTQEYIVTPSPMKIGNFLDDYYNTIEQPNTEDVLKTAMLMTLQGDGTEPSTFNNGMKYLNRLSQKLLSICGKPKNDQPLLNNTPQEITEDEYDDQNYFDFDDIEGIDLDDEDSKLRRVLKFRDCNNFEIPINSNHVEDFTYLLDKKIFDENVSNTINKTASDVYEQSDGSIPFDGFQLSLTGSYILKIPRGIISNILSPKMIFPIALIYKSIKNTTVSIKDLMKILYKLFFNVIKSLFWKFIKEFWGFVKKDLLIFVKKIASEILKNKLKKVRMIIQILINVITKALTSNISSCSEIFGGILQTITSALNTSVKIPIPGLLLLMAESLPGFSTDRAYMDAMEHLELSGINTGPIYGTENKLPSLVKGIIDAYSSEEDTNSYIMGAIKPSIIAVGPGGALLTGNIIAKKF